MNMKVFYLSSSIIVDEKLCRQMLTASLNYKPVDEIYVGYEIGPGGGPDLDVTVFYRD